MRFVLTSLKRPKQSVNLTQHRTRFLWPIVVVGGGLFAAQYVLKTFQKLNKNRKDSLLSGLDKHNADGTKVADENPLASAMALVLDKGNDLVSDLNKDKGGGSESVVTNGFRKCIGIDIGSTYSKVAIQQGKEAVPFLIENRDGSRTTPTVVQFPFGIDVAHHQYRSNDKNNSIIGSSAYVTRFLKAENTYTGSLLLPKLSSSINLGEIKKSLFYSQIATDLKITTKSKSDRVSTLPAYISTPNYFTMAQSSLVVSACRDAGLNCVASLPDAVSAVLGCIETGIYSPLPALESEKYSTVIVVDVGGSIIQISCLLVKTMPDSIPIILSEKTLLDNGGDYFDEVIVNYLSEEFTKLHPDIKLIDDKIAKQRLYDAAESAKIELSTSMNSKVNIPFIINDATGPKNLEVDLSRSQLNTLLENQISSIQSALQDTLSGGKEQLTLSTDNSLNLKAVILVGGGARMAIMKNSLQGVVAGTPLLVCQQPEEIIAIGAASYGRYTNR